MRREFTLFGCAILLGLALSATPYSQTPSPSTPSNENDELVALKAQLEVMRQYDQRLLDTVYWALGAMGTVVLLIVGLGWYTNFRLYKRDVDDLKRDLLSALRSEMDTIARDVAQGAVNSAMRDLKKMQYQMLKLEAEKWEAEGVNANALSTYARAIAPAVSLAPELYLPDILDEMLRLLKQGKMVGLHGGHVRSINELLNTVPKDFATDVEAIQHLIREYRSN